MSPFLKKKIVEDAFLYKQWWTEQVTVQGKKNVDEWQRNAELGVQWGLLLLLFSFFLVFIVMILKKNIFNWNGFSIYIFLVKIIVEIEIE